MLADNVSEGEDIQGEQGWTEYGSLGDTTGDSVCFGFFPSQGYILGPVRQVGCEPVKCRARESDGLEAGE